MCIRQKKKVSGDVMMCCWGVAKELTIGGKGLSQPWSFALISSRALFIRYSKEGQYKPRNTSTGSAMFVKLRSNVISFRYSKDFWLGLGNGFVWRARCKDWGAIAPQVNVPKKNWCQDKHRGTLVYWIWPRFLSKHFINLLASHASF